MDVLAVDLGDELRVGVEPRLVSAPVEAVFPVPGQVLDPGQADSVIPGARARAGDVSGPPCPAQPVVQVVEALLGDPDPERTDLALGCGHGLDHRETGGGGDSRKPAKPRQLQATGSSGHGRFRPPAAGPRHDHGAAGSSMANVARYATGTVPTMRRKCGRSAAAPENPHC